MRVLFISLKSVCYVSIKNIYSKIKILIIRMKKDIESLVSRLRLNLFISQTEYMDLFSTEVGNTIDNLTALLDFAVVHQKQHKIFEILSKDKPSYEEQANFAITYYFTKYIRNIEQFEDWNRISGWLVKMLRVTTTLKN